MASDITTAAVLGAGSMGAGIAALLASGGIKVHLLDLPADGDDRDARARKGIETQVKRHGFTRPEYAERVTPGNTEDHLDRLAEADWIVEAVFEDMDVKKDVFARIDELAGPGTVLATNTSRLDIDELARSISRPAEVIGLHFFSPAHVMKLLEVVRGEETSEEVIVTALATVSLFIGVARLDGFVLFASRHAEEIAQELRVALVAHGVPQHLAWWSASAGPLKPGGLVSTARDEMPGYRARHFD